MLIAGLLHDIGKPVVAHQDEDDISNGGNTYSFTGHEEVGYQIIKNWNFISERTKMLVRYHYLITGMAVDTRKFEKTRDVKYSKSYANRLKIWNSLDRVSQIELMIMKYCDDMGKGYPDLPKAVPEFMEEDYNECINHLER